MTSNNTHHQSSYSTHFQIEKLLIDPNSTSVIEEQDYQSISNSSIQQHSNILPTSHPPSHYTHPLTNKLPLTILQSQNIPTYQNNIYRHHQHHTKDIQSIDKDYLEDIYNFQQQLRLIKSSSFHNDSSLQPTTKQGKQILSCFKQLFQTQLINQSTKSNKSQNIYKEAYRKNKIQRDSLISNQSSNLSQISIPNHISNQNQTNTSLKKIDQLHQKIIQNIQSQFQHIIMQLHRDIQNYKQSNITQDKTINQLKYQYQQALQKYTNLQQQYIQNQYTNQTQLIKFKQQFTKQKNQLCQAYQQTINNIKQNNQSIAKQKLESSINQKQQQFCQEVKEIKLYYENKITQIENYYSIQLHQTKQQAKQTQQEYQYLIKQLYIQINHLNDQLRSKSQEGETLQQQIMKITIFRDQLSDQLNEVIQKNIRLREEYDQHICQIKNKDQLIGSYKNQIDSLQKYSELLCITKNHVQSEKQNLQNQINIIKQQLVNSLERQKKQKQLFEQLVKLKLQPNYQQQQQIEKQRNISRRNNKRSILNSTNLANSHTDKIRRRHQRQHSQYIWNGISICQKYIPIQKNKCLNSSHIYLKGQKNCNNNSNTLKVSKTQTKLNLDNHISFQVGNYTPQKNNYSMLYDLASLNRNSKNHLKSDEQIKQQDQNNILPNQSLFKKLGMSFQENQI